MEIISFKEIKKITSDGICYTNLEGKESFVDFKECNKNWINYQKKFGENSVTILYKYVGQRNICDNPMFIEFFTKPFVRIEFLKDNKQEFNILKNKLTLLGWETLDLS